MQGPSYIIDKQMSNTWWLGTAPPCAKVIIMERDGMDVGYGNFKTLYSSTGYEFTYNQTELGKTARRGVVSCGAVVS